MGLCEDHAPSFMKEGECEACILRARVKQLEEVVEAAKIIRRDGMIVYHTKPDCDCMLCRFDKAIGRAGRE